MLYNWNAFLNLFIEQKIHMGLYKLNRNTEWAMKQLKPSNFD